MNIAQISSNASYGKRIRMYRACQGLTQRALSELAGITPHHLSNIERGVYGAGVDVLGRIARSLGVTTAHLLGEVPFMAQWPEGE